MAEGTGIASLAGSLAKKLARDVRCVYKQQKEVSTCSCNQLLLIVRPRAVVVCRAPVGEALESQQTEEDCVTYWAGCAACCDGCFRERRWGC